MKTFLAFTLLILSVTYSFGQCDNNVTLTSSKTEYLDRSGVVQRSEYEQSTIQINKSQVIITPGNANRQLTGAIQLMVCDWGTAYQDGKTMIKVIFDEPSREQRYSTLTIEGKAGVITLLMEIAEMPDKKIRVNVTSFKEAKKE